MKNFRNVAIILATVLALSACQPQVPQLPQVPALDQAGNVIQQQVPQADGFDAGDALLGAGVGAAAGYMLGNSGGNRTTVIDNRRSSGNYNRGYGRKVITTTTTTVKRGWGGKVKSVTRSVTRSRRR